MNGVGHVAGGRGRGRQRIVKAHGGGAVRVLGDHRVLRVARRAQRGVERGQLPLAIARGHLAAVVVVGRRAPEVGHWDGAQQLLPAIAVGDEAVAQRGEQHVEVLARHAEVQPAADEAQRLVPACVRLRRGDRVDALTEGDLMPALRPGGILAQAEGDGYSVLARLRLHREGQVIDGLAQRRHIGFKRRLGDRHAVPRERDGASVRGGRGEQEAVADRHAVHADLAVDVPVAEAHLLHLRALAAVAVDDAVAAEVAVVRVLTEVAAVGVARLPEAVLRAHGLVDEVPDEPALEERLLVGVVGVLVQRAGGVAHRVRVLAEDVRLVPVLRKVRADLRRGDVHRAHDVALLREGGNAVRALVVHQARVVEGAEQVAHRLNDPAAGGLVAAAPHQHARVILVALIGGVHAVEQDVEPVHPVAGQRVVLRLVPLEHLIPDAMGLHIVLVDDVQAQLVAQGVERAVVGIVAGADGIDVVALHRQQVAADHLRACGAAELGAVVVPVDALEHHAPAVELHDAVADLEAAEAHALAHELAGRAVRKARGQLQRVQVRVLGAPQARRLHRQAQGNFVPPLLRAEHGRLPVHQPHVEHGVLRRVEPDVEREHGVAVRVVEQRPDAQVADVRLGCGIEHDVPEQAGEAHEVLILDPAAGAPAIDAAGELVFPGHEEIRQLEVVRGERIGAEADVLPVEPDGDAALRALEGDEHAPALHGLRQREGLHIAGDRVELLGHIAHLECLAPVPGILHVGVLRHAVALHLDVRGHGDVRPAAAVVIRRFKAGNDLPGVLRTEELPQPGKGQPQAAFPRCRLLPAGIGDVVGMCAHAVFREERGRREPAFIECHKKGLHVLATRSLLLSHRKGCYLTAPATALVKKMMTVGSEQMVTPAMTTP